MANWAGSRANRSRRRDLPKAQIAAGAEAEYTFLLAWHFPNRTPERCGWSAPKGHEKHVIGNWYATRFSDAWAAAEYAAVNLALLELDPPLRPRPPRNHYPRRREGSRHGQPVHARLHHLFPHRRRRVPRL